MVMWPQMHSVSLPHPWIQVQVLNCCFEVLGAAVLSSLPSLDEIEEEFLQNTMDLVTQII